MREWAESLPIAPAASASPEQIARHVSFMAATLPAKNVDDESGRMRAAVYCRLLAGYSNDALAFMARTACETLDWFPTPRQCLAILEQFHAPVSERVVALDQCFRFTQATFEAWLAQLRSAIAVPAAIGDVPDRWLRIAHEQGMLRRLPDGSYQLRRSASALTEQAEASS